MKLIELHAIITKIIKKIFIPQQNYEKHEILKCKNQNSENHENLIIPNPNNENHEISKMPYQNHEHHET